MSTIHDLTWIGQPGGDSEEALDKTRNDGSSLTLDSEIKIDY
jgi:hypothetical protein